MEVEPADAQAEWARQWFIVGRWQEYAGEWRTNLLRMAAVGAFYVVQLIHYYGLAQIDDAERSFHRVATAITAAWMSLTMVVFVCLWRGYLPPALKYISSGCDLALLTGLACLGAGPASPLILGYFLIIASTALRFDLWLVRTLTLASMAGYLLTAGCKDRGWFDAEHVVAPTQMLLTLVSLGMTGVIVGQVVRRAEQLSAEFARRIVALERRAS
ncbi:MAG: hypothetical protein U0939_13600 [Pirellulales bacterium]